MRAPEGQEQEPGPGFRGCFHLCYASVKLGNKTEAGPPGLCAHTAAARGQSHRLNTQGQGPGVHGCTPLTIKSKGADTFYHADGPEVSRGHEGPQMGSRIPLTRQGHTRQVCESERCGAGCCGPGTTNGLGAWVGVAGD